MCSCFICHMFQALRLANHHMQLLGSTSILMHFLPKASARTLARTHAHTHIHKHTCACERKHTHPTPPPPSSPSQPSGHITRDTDCRKAPTFAQCLEAHINGRKSYRRSRLHTYTQDCICILPSVCTPLDRGMGA